ncbi:MAG: aldolase/citrate lyase family protein [Planctomycetaceae bacterium]
MNLRPNRVKEKLASGGTVCCVSGLTDPEDIDRFGPAGFDAVWLEGEHGPVDFRDIGDLTRACDLWGMTSIMRINQNEQAIVYRALDRGVQGIVVPHVNTKAEAQNVVDGGKFSPVGQRGLFTSRQGYGVENYFDNANDHTAFIVLIEDIVAVNNLDEILTVDHIDVFFVAPSDLASSMGLIGQLDHPDVVSTWDGALQKISQAGRAAGTLTNNDNVSRFVDLGVRFLMVGAGGWIDAGATAYKQAAGIA